MHDKRRPWLAFLLSLVTTGLGHLYVGRPGRGLAAWVTASALAAFGFLMVVMLPGPIGVVVLVTLVIAWPLATAIDAARMARAAPVPFEVRWFSRWYVCAGIAAITNFVLPPIEYRALIEHVARAFRMPANSMAPTFIAGDYLLVAPLRDSVRRGDVVVYRTAAGTFVKRVVGLPGDTIEMRSAQLVVNAAPVHEPYESHEEADPMDDDFAWQRRFVIAGVDTTAYKPSVHTWGPLVIPRNQYFLLGDNRNNSLDSRYMGFSPRDSLIARPIAIYLSWDSAGRSVRWRRLGRVPKWRD